MSHDKNPDYRDLVKRLEQCAPHFSATGDLAREAASVISDLMETNRDLNRRLTTKSQEEEIAGLRRKLEKARRDARMGWNSYSSTFQRMMSAHDEIKVIYENIRRAVPDGCDNYGYHSVMDSRADGGAMEPATVWANRYCSKRGGVVSVRPAAAIVAVVDELLQLRQGPQQSETAKRLLKLVHDEAAFLRQRAHMVVKECEEGRNLELRREYQDHADKLDQIADQIKSHLRG